jgi:hypothetical protein
MHGIIDLFAGSGGLLLRPTLPLRVPDSLSCGGTHLALALLCDWFGTTQLRTVVCQKLADLLESRYFRVNGSDDFVYGHDW